MIRKSSDLNKDTFRGVESQDPAEGQGSMGLGPMATGPGYHDAQNANNDSIHINHPNALMHGQTADKAHEQSLNVGSNHT